MAGYFPSRSGSSQTPKSGGVVGGTVLCKFFLRGRCARGRTCAFSHDAPVRRPPPGLGGLPARSRHPRCPRRATLGSRCAPAPFGASGRGECGALAEGATAVRDAVFLIETLGRPSALTEQALFEHDLVFMLEMVRNVKAQLRKLQAEFVETAAAAVPPERPRHGRPHIGAREEPPADQRTCMQPRGPAAEEAVGRPAARRASPAPRRLVNYTIKNLGPADSPALPRCWSSPLLCARA
mmetsp:Transcript_37127/g.73914  ORF Transcript_37127/g.73914 Transcript_37127/m.73914 type:complete len:238 (+) Transcript_37127:73-786(+)